MTSVTAFDDVVERHQGEVRGFLRRRLGSATLADEATQETFVRAYVRQDTLRDPHKMGAWLLGIARRVSAEARRGHRLVPVAELPDDALGVAPSPETEYLERETCGAVARAVDALGPERREALRLRVEDELAYDDIADRLGWTLAKVKNEIHRARRQLERALAAAVAIVALATTIPQLGVVSRGELGLLDDGVPACFESGMGAVAAVESSFGACLIASPLAAGERGDRGEAGDSGAVAQAALCLDATPLCGG